MKRYGVLSWFELIGALSVALVIGLPPSLLAQSKSEDSNHTDNVVRVPFVGCRSDGQVGPIAAPKGSDKSIRGDADTARRLAFYEAANISGVLAPRGWNCFSTYGSDGAILLVSPQPIDSRDLLSPTWRGFVGPAVELSEKNGETSGRFEVAQIIARYFPAHAAFVQSVIDEGIEPASQFPSGAYPKDKVTYSSDRIVEYQTPPRAEGLGTVGRLRSNGDPIDGVAVLGGGTTPNLLLLAIRLPSDKQDLATPIIRQTEPDSAVSLARAECNQTYATANALFVHAAPVCNQNFMDSPAGRTALAMTRKCNLSKEQETAIFTKTAGEFDFLLKSKGKKFACETVLDVEKNVLNLSGSEATTSSPPVPTADPIDYNLRASQAVADKIRYVRMQEEQQIIQSTGAPRDLATGQCTAVILIDQNGALAGAAKITCDNPGLVDEMSEAVRLAAPYTANADLKSLTVHISTPVTQPGVNG